MRPALGLHSTGIALGWGAVCLHALVGCRILRLNQPFPCNVFVSSCPPAAEGSFLQQFLAATEGMSPAQRGAYLEQPPEGAPDIDSIHQVGHGAWLPLLFLVAAPVIQCVANERMSLLPFGLPVPPCRRRRSRGTRRRPALRRKWICTL